MLLQSQKVIDLGTKQLRGFIAVAQDLHFGRAARRLGIAQSALSQQVRRLEAAVGAELLVRTSRSVSLTPAGEELFEGAERIVADVERTTTRARAAQAGRLGTLAVGTQGAALNALVPKTIAALARRAPGLRIEIRQLTTVEQAAAVRAGELDIGLVREVPPHPDLSVQTLSEEPVDAVLPIDHPLASQDEVRLRDLAAEPFVLWRRRGSPQFFDRVLATCAAAGFSPTIAYEMRGIQARLGLVAAGLGVSLEAASYRTASHTGVTFLTLAGRPLVTNIQAITSSVRHDPRRDLFLSTALEVAAA